VADRKFYFGCLTSKNLSPTSLQQSSDEPSWFPFYHASFGQEACELALSEPCLARICPKRPWGRKTRGRLSWQSAQRSYQSAKMLTPAGNLFATHRFYSPGRRIHCLCFCTAFCFGCSRDAVEHVTGPRRNLLHGSPRTDSSSSNPRRPPNPTPQPAVLGTTQQSWSFCLPAGVCTMPGKSITAVESKQARPSTWTFSAWFSPPTHTPPPQLWASNPELVPDDCEPLQQASCRQ